MLEEEPSVTGLSLFLCWNTSVLTITRRHAMLVDQKTEEVVVPLNESLKGGRIELANSECLNNSPSFPTEILLGSLSEVAVLGVSVF